WRRRNRDGKYRREAESALWRYRPDDDRQPERHGHPSPLKVADTAGRHQPSRIALRRTRQHAAVELFILRDDFRGTKARFSRRPALFSHLAQLLFVTQNSDGVVGHGFHISEFCQIPVLL